MMAACGQLCPMVASCLAPSAQLRRLPVLFLSPDNDRPGREASPVLGQTDNVEACRQVVLPAERHRVPARTHAIDAAPYHLPAAHVKERQGRGLGVLEAEAQLELMLRRVGGDAPQRQLDWSEITHADQGIDGERLAH